MRGVLTAEIKELSKKLFGYEISQSELRLMPYVQFVMMNEQRLDPNKISADEREIIAKWREKGFVEGGASGMIITKNFWDSVNQILWLGYIDFEGR